MRPLLLDFTAALLLAGSLGGCAVGPDYAKPDAALPARWA
jgi:hypothetical protein